jgi:hypothetical protein
VGDAVGKDYRLVGMPDGLGAFPTGPTFTLLVNHELRADAGRARAHGSRGAFVSRWEIDPATLRVLSGEDLTPTPDHVHRWDAAARRYVRGTTAWDRHCSADLPPESALRFGNLGTTERIYFNGEEVSFGRAWARIATGPDAGSAWELPRLGKSAFENAVACPYPQAKTVVALFDDGSADTAPVAANNPSEVFVYVGAKQASGSAIERAGLTNGRLYGVRVYRDNTVVTEESDAFGFGNGASGYVGTARFDLAELGPAGDVSALAGVEIEQDAIDNHVFRFQRPEDGAWDPRPGRHHQLYFVTTGTLNPPRSSRLWRLTFADVERPELGGTIEILRTDAPGRMYDNLTIDTLGRILIQDDTGNSPAVSRIWLYGIDTGELLEVAHHDPALFERRGPRFITQDEESSGIIDAQHVLGDGWFLLDVQVYSPEADPELLTGGQLLALYVDPTIGRGTGEY